VTTGGSNHINAAGRIGGDALSSGVSTSEYEIIHRLPILTGDVAESLRRPSGSCEEI